jgi:hypothetical protein
MIPAIRSQSLTMTIGDHLKTDCPNSPEMAGVDWADVEDQQIPDSLQVQQAVPGRSDAIIRIRSAGWGGIWMGELAWVTAGLGIGALLVAG